MLERNKKINESENTLKSIMNAPVFPKKIINFKQIVKKPCFSHYSESFEDFSSEDELDFKENMLSNKITNTSWKADMPILRNGSYASEENEVLRENSLNSSINRGESITQHGLEGPLYKFIAHKYQESLN